MALVIGILLSVATIAAVRAGAPPSGWRQSNADGFGDAENRMVSLAVFDGQLYAGTSLPTQAQVWRTADGYAWTQVTPNWAVSTTTVLDMQAFGSHLYVGTYHVSGAQIWRTDGSNWEMVVSNGFSTTPDSIVNAFAVFSDTLYAAIANGMTPTVDIWRSASGNSGSWQLVHMADADASAWNNGLTVMDVYDGHLYLGITRNDVAELWRTNNGVAWTPVFTDGLGLNNSIVGGMEVYDGLLYVGLRNVVSGGQVWRSANGLNWTNVVTGGLGNLANSRPYGLIGHQPYLYLVFSNTSTGAEVWRSQDGQQWHQIMSGGWGDPNNQFADYLDHGAEVFQGSVYIGTGNDVTGAEVWQRLQEVLLPLIVRN
jgi:hypothetical protein